MMKTTTLLTAISLLLTGFTFAQQTYVPDDNFESYLETHNANGDTVSVGDPNSMGNGIADDDYVLTSRISNVTDLNVDNRNIADLTGIEDFQNVLHLKCYNNQLTSLNVTQNTDLTYLYCPDNQLIGLNVTQNTALQGLVCGFNQLTSLDVTQNTNLTYLECSGNQLTGFDVTQNTDLQVLFCYDNQLTELNVTQNTDLQILLCDENQLTDLDLTQNTALQELECYFNQLTSLDVSQNTALQDLWCYNNQLTSLNIQNGNNINLTSFATNYNPDLTCVFVDDASYMNAHWADAIDNTATYVETQAECNVVGIDENFKETVNIYPNPFNDYIVVQVSNEALINTISIKNMQGQVIYKGAFTPQIKLSHLPTGMYLLSIENNEANKTLFKLIKY